MERRVWAFRAVGGVVVGVGVVLVEGGGRVVEEREGRAGIEGGGRGGVEEAMAQKGHGVVVIGIGEG